MLSPVRAATAFSVFSHCGGRAPRIMSSPMTGRRSPDAKSIGDDGAPLDLRIQGGILHVAREPFGIEAEGVVRPQQR